MERVPPVGRARRLRLSLEACSAEGLVSEIVGVCFGPAVVAAWGVELGASPLLLAVLWGVPHVGQIFQIPAAWVTSFFGRKRVAVAVQGLARQVTLPIAILPFIDVSLVSKRALLVGLFALSSLLSVIGHNAWLAWMGDLVPERVRGTYFGRRAARCAMIGTGTTFLVTSSLDSGHTHRSLGIVLAATLVVRSLAGALTTVLMAKQHDVPRRSPPLCVNELALPIVHPVSRQLLLFVAAWGIATGLTASTSAVLTVRALGFGFSGMAVFAAITALLRIVTMPLWGRTIDRVGAAQVLVLCSAGPALSSLSWLGATGGLSSLIVIDALVCGLLLGGQELAVFTLPLAHAPRDRKALFAATSVMVSGLAFGLASFLGGCLESILSVRSLLVASTACRFGASVVAWSLARSRSIDALSNAQDDESAAR